jgi:hypothetical protein
MHSSRQCRWSSGLRDSPAEGGAQRLISRVTGQVDSLGFSDVRHRVSQDLLPPLAILVSHGKLRLQWPTLPLKLLAVFDFL